MQWKQLARLARQSELKHVLESFSRLRSSGVDKNLEEKNIPPASSELVNDH